MKQLPNLLNLEGRPAANQAELHEAVQFAFSTGDACNTIGTILTNAPIEDSNWNPNCFSNDIFLSDFVDECLPVEITDQKISIDKVLLKQTLSHPPKKIEDTRFRQAIQQELIRNSSFRTQFESVYTRIAELRVDLDSVEPMGRLYFSRWRIGILERIKVAVDSMSDAFEDSVSGIKRIREHGLAFQQTEAFTHLNELLSYEDGMATVSMNLRISASGRVRGFEIADLDENKSSRFHRGPVRRFLSRCGLLFRGYAMTGDELLERWIDRVFERLIPELCPLFTLLGGMEFHLACLSFRSLCLSKSLDVCFPSFIEASSSEGRTTTALFNPLLFSHESTPVPCDVCFDRKGSMTILTGPNSGGKTRLLQALAMAQLLGQSGFVVPARSAKLHWAGSMFVSLLEETTSCQREGRLGMELIRIRRLFEESRQGAFIVIDELCSGTNPCEGEEIFYLVITLLAKLNPEAHISTHFLRFAQKLAEDRSLDLNFLQVKLDERERPTYEFIDGVAQTSLAHHTAARLGVTKQHLLELIEERELLL